MDERQPKRFAAMDVVLPETAKRDQTASAQVLVVESEADAVARGMIPVTEAEVARLKEMTEEEMREWAARKIHEYGGIPGTPFKMDPSAPRVDLDRVPKPQLHDPRSTKRDGNRRERRRQRALDRRSR